MLPMPSDAALFYTNCTGPNIAQTSYTSYWSGCEPVYTHQYNEPHHIDLSTLLESPPPDLEHADVLHIVESSCTLKKRSLWLCQLVGVPDVGKSDMVESHSSCLKEIVDLIFGW